MPPQITFLQVTDYLSTPIKVFVRRSSSNSEPSSLSINSKSLITLKNKYHIKLSNNYLNNIVNDIKSELDDILFHKELDTTQQIIKNGVRCVIPENIIIGLRIELGIMNTELIKKKPNNYNNLSLLVREKQYVKKEEDQDELLDDSIIETTSKYKFHSKRVFGDLSSCIKIYVS